MTEQTTPEVIPDDRLVDAVIGAAGGHAWMDGPTPEAQTARIVRPGGDAVDQIEVVLPADAVRLAPEAARQYPGPDDDYMAQYDTFWRAIVEVDGRIDRDKVARELADFSHVMREYPLVLDELTGGRMSKCMYYARDIIAEVREREHEHIVEAIAEARAEWDDAAAGAVPDTGHPARPSTCTCGHTARDHDEDGFCLRADPSGDRPCTCSILDVAVTSPSGGVGQGREPDPLLARLDKHFATLPSGSEERWSAARIRTAVAAETADQSGDTGQDREPPGSARPPAEPGYERIAKAIEDAVHDSAQLDLQLFTAAGVAHSEPYLRLALILDRAGLIDWAAFAEPRRPA